MTCNPSPAPQPRPRHRRLRLVVRWGAILLMLLLALVVYLANPQRAARLASNLLGGMLNAKVSIVSASFDLQGRIVLENVWMHLPPQTGRSDRLFFAEQIYIEHDMWKLLVGSFQPRQINITHPIIYVTEDTALGNYNFGLLPPGEDPAGPMTMPAHLPEILLEHGQVEFGKLEDGRYTALDHIDFEGHLVADPLQPAHYSFRLNQRFRDRGSGATLAGILDLDALAFHASVRGFALDSPQRYWLTRQFREFWDELQPSGSLPNLSFGYDQQLHSGWYANIEVHNVELNLLKKQLRLRPTDYEMRLKEVFGRFQITQNHIQIDNLRGQIDGLRYEINGQIQGFDDSAPFSLSLRTDEYDLSPERQVLLAMPELFEQRFGRFFERGRFKALLHLERQEVNGPIRYEGAVQVIEADGLYYRFPYPLRQVRGQLRFSGDRLEVSLHGQHPNGAKFVVNGTVTPPWPRPAVDLTVTGFDVPLDPMLRQAFNERRRKTYDLYLNQTQHQRLVEMGLIQTSESHRDRREAYEQLIRMDEAERDEATQSRVEELHSLLAIPVFDLGGRVDVIVRAVRRSGPDEHTVFTADIDLRQVNMLFARWPYPLRITSGKLAYGPDKTTLHEVRAQTLHGERSVVFGEGELRQSPEGTRPELNIQAAHIPMDELLRASVLASHQTWLTDLHMTGELDAAGRVFVDDQGQTDFRVIWQLRDGRAQPLGGAMSVDPVSGAGVLCRDYLDIERLEGKCGVGELALSGHFNWSQEPDWFRVRIHGRDLSFEDLAADQIPAAVPGREMISRLWKNHRPTGRFDGDLWWSSQPNQTAENRLELRPQTLALDWRQQRIELADMTGSATLDGVALRLNELAATFDQGRFTCSGWVGLEDQPSMELTLTGRAGGIGPVGRAVVPSTVGNLIRALDFQGGYELQQARIIRKPKVTDQPYMNFSGRIVLEDAKAKIGLPIDQLFGDLAVTASWKAEESWPSIELALDISQLRLLGRHIQDLTLRLENTEPLHLLRIERIQGHCYGGALIGTGAVELGEPTRYHLRLSLQDARLDQFLRPPESPPPPDAADLEASKGMLSAGLELAGQVNAPDSHRGRGDLEVSGANLYNLPLAMALLQIVNLSWPSASAFDRVHAQYLVDGQTIRFDQLAFVSPTVEVTGTGTLEYPSGQLDLHLVSRNPAALNMGPVTQMLDKVKDELISIQVSGTLKQPVARASSFAGFRRSWGDIFGQPQREDGREEGDQRGPAGGASSSGQ